MLKTPVNLSKSVLVKRLIYRLIISAAMLMLVSLVVTAFLTWSSEKRGLENQFKEIERNYGKIIQSALWENDAETIKIILMSLSQMPGIQSAHIHQESRIRFKAGEKDPDMGFVHNFQISRTYNGKVYELGHLHVEQDPNYVSQKIIREVLVIGLSQAAIILLVSLLMFVLTYRFVIVRLLTIQSHTASLSPDTLNEQMMEMQKTSDPDELDDLSKTISKMQNNLQASFAAQKALERELRQDQEKLEDIVRERTASLNTINEQLLLEIGEKEKLQAEREKIIVDLQSALDEVKKLSGMLPICANCKKIRDDKGYWNQLEGYISKHSEAVFSHGICPECAKKLYPDFDLYEE